MIYVSLFLVGIIIGCTLGFFVAKTKIHKVGILHVNYEDSDDIFPDPLLFLELQTSVGSLYKDREVRMTVVFDPQK